LKIDVHRRSMRCESRIAINMPTQNNRDKIVWLKCRLSFTGVRKEGGVFRTARTSV